jgi:hypothetical protein
MYLVSERKNLYKIAFHVVQGERGNKLYCSYLNVVGFGCATYVCHALASF